MPTCTRCGTHLSREDTVLSRKGNPFCCEFCKDAWARSGYHLGVICDGTVAEDEEENFTLSEAICGESMSSFEVENLSEELSPPEFGVPVRAGLRPFSHTGGDR